MKGLIDFTGLITGEQDLIYQYGPAIETDPNAVNIPDDFSFALYNYTPSIVGVYDPNGFFLKPTQSSGIDFDKRQSNINQMNSYMDSLRLEGALTQANFDLFLADIATNIQGYLNGGSRLITWIETVNRNGYNASTIGFKTKTAYRGTLVNGLYPRAEMILSILNNL
jgi:hypothetical protein